MGHQLDIRILGPLDIRVDGESIRLGGERQRSVLAVLALHVGGVVSIDSLVDSLWGDAAPTTATTAVYGHIAALRKLLGPETIVTCGRGYMLAVDPETVDAQRFARLLETTDPVFLSGLPLAERLSDALSLWRGEPLSDVEHDFFGEPETTRLVELRLSAVEQRFDALLGAGRHAELLPELDALVAANPLRERLRGQLMVALYRSGRQADALSTYEAGRQLLARELGIEPGGALRDLEGRILRHDPNLLPEHPVPGGPAPAAAAPTLARKFATALFADVVGFTAMTEREDPEVVQALLAQTFERVSKVIEEFGGTVEHVLGDAVLAMFGVPVVHEDDPLRAVRAALEIQRAVTELGLQPHSSATAPLSFHIGIEAGEVLVQTHPDRARQITGDAVNTAARLQTAAEPGAILVGPGVHSLTKAAVDYQRVTPLQLKGKAEPVPAFVALRTSAEPATHPDRRGLEARLVGRDLELQLLEQQYRRVVNERRPALATIFGPAGVGKSRLGVELVRRLELAPDPPSWRTGRCRAYGNVPYSALAEAMQAQCGILNDDPHDVATEKAASTVERVFGTRKLAPPVEALVGGSEPTERFSREELFDAWRRFLERAAAPAPLVLVLEDIHWADAGLLDFVEHLADWAQSAIFVVTLARPELLELRPLWGGGKRNATTVYLDPLSKADTEAMVTDLLSAPLPAEVMDLVFERGEGNPLFSEEIVRMLIDRSAIVAGQDGWRVSTSVATLDIPRSVHAVIEARIDALPDEERTVLQRAAVVGRTFWRGAACCLAGLSLESTDAALAGLQSKDLIVPREPATLSGEAEYSFRHVLIRDVAYETLSKALRAEKHMELARWAEAQAGDRRDDLAELLATHGAHALRLLEELGRGGKVRAEAEHHVFTWARAAGERALRLWQQPDAISWFEAALAVAEPVGAPAAELASLWESYGRASEEVRPYDAVARAFRGALELYDQLGASRDCARIETRLAFIAHQLGDRADVEPLVTNALARLEPMGDSGDLAKALHVLGWHLFRQTRYAEAEPQLRRAAEVAGRVRDRVTLGHSLVSLAFVLQQTGRGPQALAQFEQALALAREVSDVSLLLRVLTHICGALEETEGAYERAKSLAQEGNDLARRAGNVRNVAWSEQMLSDLHVDTGDLDLADTHARAALQAARTVGEQLTVAYALHRIAYLHALRGETEEAARVLAEARPILAVNPEPWLQGWDPLIEAHIAQGRGEDDTAAQVLVEGTASQVDRVLVWGGKHLLLECIRSLIRVGRDDEVEPFAGRLRELAATSWPARAFLRWTDGLLDPDPERRRTALVEAVDQLSELGQRVDTARARFDLARALRQAGTDPTAQEELARRLLRDAGAVLFLREDSALGEGF